ncbi:MAG: response regulator transcription factor [Planctomycetota bacterium]|nr:response regulator transcription factor [Planctomycetota bacterium]
MFENQKAKVLVVEDSPTILMGLRDALEFEGYDVLTANNGVDGLQLALNNDPDVVVLDIMMPKMDGYDVLRKLRENRIRGGVILLTAKKEEVDKVKGLKLGADDYVTKPFSVIELVARVQAVLRRTEKKPDELRWVQLGDVRIDFESLACFKAGKKHDLTLREAKMLRLFIDRAGQVVSRKELLDKVWGYDIPPETRTVDNHMVKLRKLVEDNPSKPKLIKSVRRVGYKLEGEIIALTEAPTE